MPQSFSQSGCLGVLRAALNNLYPAAGRNLTLRLFTNDVTPAGDSTSSTFVEATGGGYEAKVLTNGSWLAAIVGGIPQASFTAQTFAFTGGLTTNTTVRGWFITDADGYLVSAQRRANPVVPDASTELTITPLIRLAYGSPIAPVSQAPLVIGYNGVAAFDALTTQQRAAIWLLKFYFQHKSVGGNILGDAADQGVQHYGPDFFNNYSSTSAAAAANTLCERIFDAENGDPLGKYAEFQTRVLTHGIGAAMVASAPAGTRAVVALKNCFTDLGSLNSTLLPQMKTAYLAMVNAISSALPSLRFLHVGMPLGTAALWDLDVAHPLRIDFFAWMRATFTDPDRHFFFDLHDAERHHADGTTASVGALPVLCDEWAAVADSSGHLGAAGANFIAKSFLYAIHVAGTT